MIFILFFAWQNTVTIPIEQYQDLRLAIEKNQEIEKATKSWKPETATCDAVEIEIHFEPPLVHYSVNTKIRFFESNQNFSVEKWGLLRTQMALDPQKSGITGKEDEITFYAIEPGRYSFQTESSAQFDDVIYLPKIEAGSANVVVHTPIEWTVSGLNLLESKVENNKRIHFFSPTDWHENTLIPLPYVDPNEPAQVSMNLLTCLAVEAKSCKRTDYLALDIEKGGLRSIEVELSGYEGHLNAYLNDDFLVSRKKGNVWTILFPEKLRQQATLRLETDAPHQTELGPWKSSWPLARWWLGYQAKIPADVHLDALQTDMDYLNDQLKKKAQQNQLQAFFMAQKDQVKLEVSPIPVLAQRSYYTNRNTQTVLTRDGSSMHRIELEIDGPCTNYQFELENHLRLWSCEVNARSVQPHIDGKMITLPVNSIHAEITLVLVSQQAQKVGQRTLQFNLPNMSGILLNDQWQVFVPDNLKYQIRETTLFSQQEPQGIFSGKRNLVGKVTDQNGEDLPGVVVSLESGDDRESTVSDAEGRFVLKNILKKDVKLTATMAGFNTYKQRLQLAKGTSSVEIVMAVSSVSEELMVVTAEPQRLRKHFDVEDYVNQAELKALSGAVTRGVKPVPFDLPKTGKKLEFSGILPQTQTKLTLASKR